MNRTEAGNEIERRSFLGGLSTFGLTSGCAMALAGCLVSGCSPAKPVFPQEEPGLKVSVSHFSIDDIAKERGISLQKAADLLKAEGVTGFDCAFDDPRLTEYAATGLRPTNLYGQMGFFAADGGAARARAFVDAAVRVGCPRIMVLADDFTNGEHSEAEFAKIVDGVRMLQRKAEERGVTVTVETQGCRGNCCSSAKYVARLLDAIPGLGFTLDTGNLAFAGRGDDIVGLAKRYGDRVKLVHLKDFALELASDEIRKLRPYVTIGLGIVPNEELVRHMKSIGFDGRYTLEHPIEGDTIGDVRRQIATLRRWLTTEPQTVTKELWTRPIAVEPDRYIAWPTAVTLRDGTIIACFSGDRDWHFDPYGKVQMVRSTDNGETWSEPVTLADSIIDDRDCGIVQLPDGELFLSWYTATSWRRLIRYQYASGKRKMPKNPSESLLREIAMAKKWVERDAAADVKAERTGFYCMRSRDGGKTWGPVEEQRIKGVAPHGPIVLRDGSLLLVARHTEKIADGTTRSVVYAEKSTDGGRTWKVICRRIPIRPEENYKPNLFCEPHVAELPDGRLITLVRYEGKGDDYLRQAASADGGKTWSTLTKTPIKGFPAHLKTLPDGRLLAVYGRRQSDRPNDRGEFAVLSSDGGATWDVAREIALGPRVPLTVHDRDFGYPSSVLTADGCILTIYYGTVNESKPALMCTKWSLESKGRK